MDDRKEQDGPTTPPGPRRKVGRIVAVTILAIVAGLGIFLAGYAVGSTSSDSKPSETALPPINDSDILPNTPPRVCGAPSPLNPGTDVHEPIETKPPTPTEPCTTPTPDIIVLISAAKAKELPSNLGGIDCETLDGYGADYRACDPRPATDVEAIAKKVLTPEQLAFVNDHVLSSETAYWAFDVQDTATLKNQYMVPGAAYDTSTETITVYIW